MVGLRPYDKHQALMTIRVYEDVRPCERRQAI